jgi:lipopolysaccharide transport system permease protein
MNLLAGHGQALREGVLLVARHRRLAVEMARREVGDRYSGQAFGVLWAIGHPLFLLSVYAVVFGLVFRTKLGGTYEMPLDYTAYLLSGLIPWMGFQESMTRSCSSITGSAPLVKQMVFPLEVLPVRGVLVATFTQSVLLLLLAAYVLATTGGLHVTYLLVPLLLALQVLAMIGVAFLFSATSVFLRDLKDFVQLFCLAGMYLVPAFYLPAWVPDSFKPLLYLNPFSYLVWCYQDALYFGRIEHPWAWVVTSLGSVAVFVLGYRVFRRLKPAFGNVL